MNESESLIRWKFFVAGLPATQGSKKAFVVKGRARLVESSGEKLRSWREAVAWEARRVRAEAGPLTGPVGLVLRFAMLKPQAAPKKKRTWPVKPLSGDLDKLQRSIYDSLTGVLFLDDAQVQWVYAEKDWADEQGPGVHVIVREVIE